MPSAALMWLWCLLALAPRQSPQAQGPQVQPQKPPAGLVVGQVVDAVTNRSVSGATVTISAPASKRVLTDDAGRFLFRDLPKASYSFTATAPGYLDGGYGQRRIGGAMQPFALAEDQKVGDVVIRLWKEATLSGVVTDDIGSPVAGVSVSLVRREAALGGAASPARPSLDPGQFRPFGLVETARTDDRGAYRFGGLLPGEYLVSVKNRMTAMPVGMTVDQASAQLLSASGSMSMSMMARGPATAVRIGDFLLQTGMAGSSAGTNHLLAVLPSTSASQSANAGPKVTTYATTYYPSARTPLQATTISLAAGTDRSDVNLRLMPVTMTRVSGRLEGPDGPLPGFPVHLIPAYAANGPLEREEEAADTATDATGAFTFIAVPPGQYVLKAYRMPQPQLTDRDLVPDASLWGQTTVTVGADPAFGLSLTLRPGGTISGKIVFEGAATVPTPSQLQSFVVGRWFEPAWQLAIQEGVLVRGRVNASGEFQSVGLPPGVYTARLAGRYAAATLKGWFLESVTLDGKDLLISPVAIDGQSVTGVVIRFTDRATQLSGAIQDATGKPDITASVLIFPADYKAWIQNGMLPDAAQVVTASQAGTYQVPDIRPGEYLVAAVGDVTLANWQQPATIEALAPFATRVALKLGDAKQLDLKTVRR